jgi:arylsulfatase A-like enzyme
MLMSKGPGFRSTVSSLWFQLIALGAVSLVFCEALLLAQGKAQGWTFYLRPAEVAFEVIVRLITASIAGILLGSIVTIVITPLLWVFASSRERIAGWIRNVGVIVVVFVCSRYVVNVMIAWTYRWGGHRALYDKVAVVLFYVFFALALILPRRRKDLVGSLDGFLAEKVTRRAALATVAGTAALVATEFVLHKRLPGLTAASTADPPKKNFLLITFDALSAEDMSLYGYRLPTTPNIDRFAQKSTVFQNYYAGSTFTTPTIATMVTGLYPSQTGVYQMRGRVSQENARNSLPHQLRVAGYSVAAFLSNPLAFYVTKSIESEFNVLPEPVFRPGVQEHIWEGTRLLHQDSGVGSRMDEYLELEQVINRFGSFQDDTTLRFRPTASFQHARELVEQAPDGFFVWVHVLAPHDPYLPDPQEQNRYIPQAEVLTFPNDGRSRFYPTYKPSQQPIIDRRRLAYNEYISTADRAFGEFMQGLEKSGKLANTTVIISADHGESFEGGVYRHETAYLTRPVLHIPLIIREPGQAQSRTITMVVDQTSLAPTILDLAGIAIPDSMKGPSLAKLLDGSVQEQSGGVAFCQFLEKNSAFKPLRHGSIGVIDREFQYVCYLDTQKGELRPLNEAQNWNLDRSAEYPERAKALREVLKARFPDLVQG